MNTRRSSEGALLDTEWYVVCIQVLRIQYHITALTRNRSRRQGCNPLGHVCCAVLTGRARRRCVCQNQRVPKMNRKRRTVLWLYTEDYDYLSAVAEHDMDSKNVSMHRLVKALRAAGVKSFLRLDETLKRLPPPQGRA